MSADKATPCPWSINGVALGLGCWRIDSMASGPVALVPAGADAALIVRAVNVHDDLLNALRECARELNLEAECYRDDEEYQPKALAMHATVDRARAVIARAEGGQP